MNVLRWGLFPFAYLYDGVTRLRNFCFDKGWLEERSFALPTIVVGNLAVGGTGKTPHVEYLLRLLQGQYRCATLSRGYGRRTKGYAVVEEKSSAEAVGDEPLQIKQKYPNVRVVVDEDRCHGMEELMQTEAEVVLLDDAFQHRYLRGGLRILLTDYAHRYSRDYLLPMGRLREARKGAERADLIVVTKCPPHLTQQEQEAIAAEVRSRAGQEVFFTHTVYAEPCSLFPDAPPYAPSSAVLLLTGIARPAPLLRYYEEKGQAHLLSFPDHHRFTQRDIAKIEKEVLRFPQTLTTEKDATRLRAFASHFSAAARQRMYVQPMAVEFLTHEQHFQHIIQHYVSTHTRNR